MAVLFMSVGDIVVIGPLPRLVVLKKVPATMICPSGARTKPLLFVGPLAFSKSWWESAVGNADAPFVPWQKPVTGSQVAKLGQKGCPWHTPAWH
jgi:hypothetical protein